MLKILIRIIKYGIGFIVIAAIALYALLSYEGKKDNEKRLAMAECEYDAMKYKIPPDEKEGYVMDRFLTLCMRTKSYKYLIYKENCKNVPPNFYDCYE